MRTMFAITHVGYTGLRRLTLANQGRNHYATRADAEAALEAYRGPNGLARILTREEVSTLRVDEIECYDHGDSVRYYIDE